MRAHISRLLSLLMVFSLVASTLTLTACGGDGDKKQAETEQDDCYGDDLPVVNEED